MNVSPFSVSARAVRLTASCLSKMLFIRDVGYRMVFIRVIGDLDQFLRPVVGPGIILLQVVSLPSGRNVVIYRDQARGTAVGLG
jgi:hypothetical protein